MTHEPLLFGFGILVGLVLSVLLRAIPTEPPKAPAAPPVQVCPPRQDTDAVCAAWLFRGDLEHARKRICRSR